MLRVIEMTNVIYADVLFIINTYVTYILLFTTAFLAKEKCLRLRLVIASFIGGVYSFIILLGEINLFLSLFLRFAVAGVFVFAGFKIRNKRHFLKLYALFFLVNFIFAGIILALWYTFSPTSLYFNSGVLYLDIGSLSLITLSAGCYLIIKVIGVFLEFRTPRGRIFAVTLTLGEENVSLRGFLDTGNSLKDPFSGESVLIVSEKSIASAGEIDFESDEMQTVKGRAIRFIPCSTVWGSFLMPVFRVDKIKIDGVEKSFEKKNVLVGITKETLKNGEYDILLCDEFFEDLKEKVRSAL